MWFDSEKRSYMHANGCLAAEPTHKRESAYQLAQTRTPSTCTPKRHSLG